VRAQVLAVVVAEVVVGRDARELDTGGDEEVDEGGLHLGLAGLEVVAADEGGVARGEVDAAGDEGVLGGAVDEGDVFEDGGDGEDGGGGDLFVASLDGGEEVVGRVVDAGDEVGEALGVCGPEDNDAVETVGGLEVANIFAKLLDVGVAGFGAGDQIVGAIFLVGRDEVGIVDRRERVHLSHLLADKLLDPRLENLGAVHGGSDIHLANVPSTNDEVVGVDHGEELVEWDVNFIAIGAVVAELDGRAHDYRSVVVGLLLALLGVPHELAAVGQNTCGDGGTIVTSPSNKHHTDFANLTVDLEVVSSLLWCSSELSIGTPGDCSAAVGVLAADLVVGVADIG